jgi:hypothetical protein
MKTTMHEYNKHIAVNKITDKRPPLSMVNVSNVAGVTSQESKEVLRCD